MKVYVIMGNDFPEAVFKNEKDAEEFCEGKREEDKARRGYGPGVYWRSYAFDFREGSLEQ